MTSTANLKPPAGDDVFQAARFPVKFFNGFAQAVDYVKFISFELFVLFFYSQVLGLSGFLTGLAILISMIVDAITDPVIGSWSDSIRSRFGRRHTPMLTAVIPVALFFYLLFAPPSDLEGPGLFAWLTGVCIGLRIALTFFSAPASAMTAEISPHPSDRAEMGIYRQAISAVIQLVLLGLAFDLFFAPSEAFPNGQENPDAYPGFGMLTALAIMFFMLVTIGGTWKHLIRFESRLGPAVRTSFSFSKAIGGWVDAIGGSPNFRAIFFGLLFASTMGSCYRSLSLYLGTYLWELEPAQIKVWQQIVLVGMFTMAISTRFIVTRTEPKYVYLTGYCMLLSAYALPPAITMFGLMPPSGSQGLLYTVYAFNAMAGAGAGLLMICSLILFAEAADEFFFVKAISRTGMLFGLITFGNKAASGMGKLLAGWLSDAVGFPSREHIDQLTPEILNNLVFWLVIITVVVGTIGLLILSTFHLPRARHLEILEGIRRLSRGASPG